MCESMIVYTTRLVSYCVVYVHFRAENGVAVRRRKAAVALMHHRFVRTAVLFGARRFYRMHSVRQSVAGR